MGSTSLVRPQAWKVPPNSQGGECSKHWAQHPLPGSALPWALEAERSGRRARLGWGSCDREAPLSPAPWFVPSTFALSNFIVGKYLLKVRRFVKFFDKKKKKKILFLEYFQTWDQKGLEQTQIW